MANKDYVIKVSLDGDASGLNTLATELSDIEKMADGLSSKKISVSADVSGSALDTIKDIDSKLSSLDDRTISINVSGSVESSLKNIEGHLDKISKKVSTKVDVKGNAESELKGLQSIKDRLEKPITVKIDANDSTFRNMLGSLNAIESRLGSVNNSLKNLSAPDDIGMGQLVENMNALSSRIGSVQTELNSLSVPDLTPRMNTPDLSNYYASFDSMGNMSLGSFGGSSILSMMGLSSVKSLTWGNAVADQMNDQLLLKMPRSSSGEGLEAKNWEGGTDNLAHAVTQNRLVRKTELIPQVYAFTMGTPAKYEDLTADLYGMDDDFYGTGTGMDVLAAFMEHVSMLDGPVRAQSAVFDLSKAFDGAYASVDQYGISEANLKEHGFDAKSDDKTMKQYLKAVGEIIGADESNVLVDNTMEGGMAKLTKRFHNSGQKLGKMMMQPVNDLMSVFTWLDKQDWKFMGITIPKGTLSQGIIALTGITSSIDPLIRTSNQLKNTFGKLTEGFDAFKNKIGGLGDKLRGLRDATGVEALGQTKINFNNPSDILRELGRTKSIEDGTYRTRITHGLFDYDNHLIDASENLSDWQKGLLKNQKRSTSRIFDLAYGEDYVEREAERNLKGNKKYKEADWKTQQEMLGETRGKIRKSKLNEINSKTFLQKLRLGAKGSFRGTRSAFSTDGVSGGLRAVGTGFRNLGGVLGGLLGAINPVTIVLYSLMGVMAALGGIFLIAYANSEKFRNKLGELSEKLHELFDTFVFTLGDTLQALGITENGGAEGISDFATQILDVLTNAVDYLRELLLALTGRDLTQSKKTDELEGQLRNSINKLKNEEKEKGYGNASHKAYQDVINQANQIKMWDPTYWSDDKMDEYAEKYGLNFRDDVYTDTKGVNLGRDILQADLDDPWFSETTPSTGPAWNYYEAEVVPSLEKQGVHVKSEDLLNSLKTNGKWDEEKRQQLNTAISQDKLYIMTNGADGVKWNDNPFVKANSALHSEEQAGDEEKRNGGVSAQILGGVLTLGKILQVVAGITALILAAIVIDKLMGKVDKIVGGLRGFARLAHGEGFGTAIKTVFKNKFPHLSKLFEGHNLNRGVTDKLGRVFGKSEQLLGKGVNKIFNSSIGKSFLGIIERVLNSGIGRVIGRLLGRAVSFIPIVGQIIGALWLAWDITSMICDFLSSLGVPEWVLEMFFPLRQIQNHWKDITDFITGLFTDPIGAIKTALSKLWDAAMDTPLVKFLSGIYGKLQEIGQGFISWLTDPIGSAKNALSGLWGMLANTPLGRILSITFEQLQGISGFFGDIGGKLTEIGQSILQWLTDPIGSAKDMLSGFWEMLTNSPLGSFLSGIIGQIEWLKSVWDLLTTSVSTFGQTLMSALDSIGLGAVADAIQYIWDKLVGFYEWLKGLPIVGWLMPDGGTAESATQDMTNSTQALSNSSENVDNSNSNMWDAAGNILGFLTGWGTTGSAFNSSAGSTAYQNGAVQPINGQGAPNSLQQQAQQQNVVNNNVHIDGGGITAEELAKLVVKVLNEHVFWDAQKAGRTIDTGGIVGSVGL